MLPILEGTSSSVWLELARARQSQWRILSYVRPAALGDALRGLLDPEDRRAFVPTRHGEVVYADVFSNLGRTLIDTGEYEPETRACIENHLRKGDTFIDIGANEGSDRLAGSSASSLNHDSKLSFRSIPRSMTPT